MTFSTNPECAEFGCPNLVADEGDSCDFCQEAEELERDFDAWRDDKLAEHEDWFRGER